MRALKILAATAAAVVGVLIVAVVIVAYLFDPNDYKDYLTGLVEERTGRSFSVDEDLELSFFPWLAVETGGVTLGNHPSFGDEPFATVETLSARVRVWPLLRREIEIGTVVVDGVVLNLGTDADGNTNWSDLAANAGATAPEAAPQSDAPAGIERLAIEGVRIRNGRVLWREGVNDVRYIVSGLELATGTIGETEPVDLALAMSVLDVASQLTLEVELDAVADLTGGGALRNVGAEFGLLDTRGQTRAAGTLTLAAVTRDAAGHVTAGALALRSSLSEPPIGPERIEAALDWQEARFDPAAQTVSVAGFTTRLGDVSAHWELAGSSLLESPQIAGNLRIEAAAASALVETFALTLPAGIDPRELGNLSADARFGADLGAREIELGELSARMLGFELRGNAVVAADGALRAELAVPRFTPSAALRELAAGYAPDAIDLDAIESVALLGSIERPASGSVTTLDDLELALGPATLSGNVRIDQAGARGTRYRGAIRSSRLPPNFVTALAGDLLTEELGAREVGAVAIDARFDFDTGADRLSLSPLTLEAFGLDARGEVTVAGLTTSPVVSGRAELGAFAPREFLRRFGQPVPQTSDASALSRASVTGRFLVDAEHGEFTELVVNLDESRISGDFRVDRFDDPSYRFDLSADRIDVDRYLPPPAEEAGDGERAAGDIELASEPLNALRLSGSASVGDLKLANLRFQQVSTNLRIGDGTALIDSARANLYGGSFDGGLEVDTNGEQPTMRLTGRASRLSLQPLIEALAGDANVSGTGNFDIDLEGRGPTVTDTLRTAAGTMRFELTSGAIEGFNLGRTLCSAYNTSQQLPQPPSQPAITRFELIQATATVSDGIATSRELLARSTFMDVTGSGRLTLAEARLDYDMTATLTSSIEIERCESMDRHMGSSIPFTIRGPVTAAEIRPDLGQLIEDRLRERLQERTEDRLRERLEERLRDLL